MTQALHQDTTTAAIALISTNMLQQIIALQQVINSRGAEQRFPTTQEMGLLSKMISGLEKLKRFLAPPRPNYPRSAGNRTQSKKEAEPTERGKETLLEFANGQDAAMRNGEHDTANAQVAQDPGLQPIFPPANTEAAHFPILEHELDEYRHLFDDTRLRKARTFYVKGKQYSTNWLQYNLYQYCLPPLERRFLYDEANYYREIDHEKTSLLITKYLKEQQVG